MKIERRRAASLRARDNEVDDVVVGGLAVAMLEALSAAARAERVACDRYRWQAKPRPRRIVCPLSRV